MARLKGDELTKRMPSYRRAVKWMWALFILGILSVIAIFIILSYSDLPNTAELENPKSELATEIYSSDGVVLGRYYVENRVPVEFGELSPNVVNALVATEDERYFEHSGIDFYALARASIKPVLTGSSAGGGSTITQQLSKLLFTVKPASGFERVVQKLKEWIIAVRLERKYTKEEIMAMYLNKFDFLYDSDGIKAAAETYFGKDQKDLTIDEAAILVGMLKNPDLYNPKKRPEIAKRRRNVVLYQMERNDLITQEGIDSLSQKAISMANFKRSNHAQGLAPYFRMELAKDLKFKILNKEENKKPDGSKYNIYKDGLKIYTTLDSRMQSLAEKEMVKHMTQLQDKFWRTWRKMDPWTHETESETEVAVEYRQRSLQRIIESSDRYAQLHGKYMSESIERLRKEMSDFEIKDSEIKLLLEEEKAKGAISTEIRNKKIKANRGGQLRRVLKSENWGDIKKDWKKFQIILKTTFNKKVKMKVFTYENEKFEKDTVMSPMDSIRYHRMHLQLGSLGIDPASGDIKFWVGGINHKYFQFDHIRSKRQVGSTFKPFVYATAINQQGISPCFTVYDQPQTIAPGEGNFHLDEPWTPRNARENYSGALLTLYEGLQKSINTVSVYLMKQLGDARPVIQTCRQMGVKSSIVPAPSIALGSCDLEVFEMAGAYTTFANNGIANKPIYITRVEDKNGKEIYSHMPEERTALHPTANYVMVDMLRRAVRRLDGVNVEYGGKTGTTNDFSDGWFMGITPNLVVGTWVGGEDRWIHFRDLKYGQGGHMARPFFTNYLKSLVKDKEIGFDNKAVFYRPPGDLGIEINCDLYKEGQLPSSNAINGEDGFGEDQFGDEVDTTKQINPLEEDEEEF